MRIHFACSLPRSGSTLLLNILAQNPRFHGTHTSGCLDVLFNIRNHWDTLVEHKAHPLPEVKRDVMRAALRAYHARTGKEVVIDKSRGWLGHLEMAENLLGRKAKVLVCVRDIVDVLASLEKLHRATGATTQPPGEAKHYFQFQTLKGRCDTWLAGDGLIGLAHNRITDAVRRGLRDRMHVIHYTDLTTDPEGTLRGVYDFLGEPHFRHDFNNVRQVTQEDDAVHGYVGLHVVRPAVAARPSDAAEVLGADLAKLYSGLKVSV